MFCPGDRACLHTISNWLSHGRLPCLRIRTCSDYLRTRHPSSCPGVCLRSTVSRRRVSSCRQANEAQSMRGAASAGGDARRHVVARGCRCEKKCRSRRVLSHVTLGAFSGKEREMQRRRCRARARLFHEHAGCGGTAQEGRGRAWIAIWRARARGECRRGGGCSVYVWLLQLILGLSGHPRARLRSNLKQPTLYRIGQTHASTNLFLRTPASQNTKGVTARPLYVSAIRCLSLLHSQELSHLHPQSYAFQSALQRRPCVVVFARLTEPRIMER